MYAPSAAACSSNISTPRPHHQTQTSPPQIQVPKAEIILRDDVPPKVKANVETFWACANGECGKLFWEVRTFMCAVAWLVRSCTCVHVRVRSAPSVVTSLPPKQHTTIQGPKFDSAVSKFSEMIKALQDPEEQPLPSSSLLASAQPQPQPQPHSLPSVPSSSLPAAMAPAGGDDGWEVEEEDEEVKDGARIGAAGAEAPVCGRGGKGEEQEQEQQERPCLRCVVM